ncbi:S24 family peptidase [Salipiger abyssi]|uniref:S24 family peptidase n=1 Tax=Salipiger abyssi TaxID=1250539 RepID=UPI00081A366E|nr:S24 family peptidase [Salipiger abyssi]ALF02142.1 putative transcriptional regulator [Pelagibaca phage vB_PeaS-P1]
MDAQNQLIQAIEAKLAELKLRPYAAEQRFGLPADTLRNILRAPVKPDSKKAGPTLAKVADVCAALGLEIYIGPPRETGMPPPPPPEGAFANVPLHEASLAAGAGWENGTEEIVDYLAFRRDWLRRIGVAPTNAALARVAGDSMQPTIWAGDMVLIDTTRTEVAIRGGTSSRRRSPIYAILDDGAARVKRIERPREDQVILLSDNPDHGPEFTDVQTLSIIGKVMWWGHTSKE